MVAVMTLGGGGMVYGKDDRTLIIGGGGVAGIHMGYRLQEQGQPSSIWEMTDKLAGKAAIQHAKDGATFDTGANGLPSGAYRDLFILAEELGMKNRDHFKIASTTSFVDPSMACFLGMKFDLTKCQDLTVYTEEAQAKFASPVPFVLWIIGRGILLMQEEDYFTKFVQESTKYNLLVVVHQLYFENTDFIETDVLTSLIISPRTGLRYKNSKNESIQIGLKIAEKANVIERPSGSFVTLKGVKRMIKDNGKYTGEMLWQNATNFVINSRYEKEHTQKTQESPVTTIIVSNIAAVTPKKRKGIMKNVSLVPAAHWKETEDDNIVDVLPFHYNTRNHLPRRNYTQIDYEFDDMSGITNDLEGNASWTSSSF